MKQKASPQAAPALFVLVCILAMSAGCRRARPGMPYQFESRPNELFFPGPFSTSPQMGLSPSGALFLLGAYGDAASKRLGLVISHNGGDTFEQPVPVTGVETTIRTAGESAPNLSVTSTAIYALWEQASVTGGSDILFAREPSPGQPFQKPVNITDKSEPSFNGFSALAVAPNGSLYAAWLDGRPPLGMRGTFSVYLARSTDRGASFGPNIFVASGSCPCCKPRLAFGANGEVYVFWRKVFHGQIRDMVASVSKDGGQTFAEPVRVSEDNWNINGCPESGPMAVAAGNRVYVAWMTEADQQHAGVKLSWTDDGGKSFAPAVLASQGLLDANHPSLSASADGNVALVFQARSVQPDGAWNPVQAYMVAIGAEGSLSQPFQLSTGPTSVSYPVVTLGPAGRAFVAWTNSSDKGTTIALARGRKSAP